MRCFHGCLSLIYVSTGDGSGTRGNLSALSPRELAEYDDRELRLTRPGLLRVDTILPIFFEEAHQPKRGS